MYVGSRLAAALVVPLLLTACSEDPEPRFDPPVSESPTSSSPAPTPEPEVPAVARENSADGAAAFVAHWVALFNYAQATGDVAALSQVSDSRCTACSGIISGIADTYSSGGSVTGGELSVGPARELPADYGADFGWFAKGRSAAQVIDDGAGSQERHEGSKFSMYAYTAWVDGAWSMSWLRTPS